MVPSLPSSHRTEVYEPKPFFPHAALLGQAFAHCPIFPTAASRRSLDRLSVPMWPITLSGRLPIVALVGWSAGEESGITGVAVKCVEIGRNTSIQSNSHLESRTFTPDLAGRLRALYAQSFRTTLAPYVLPRLLARS